MARYYFNVRSGEIVVKDDEGQDLSNLNVAREHALACARELVAEAIRFARPSPDCLVIADESGREVARLQCSEVLPSNLC